MPRVVDLAKLASVLLLTTGLAACERSATAPTASAIAPRLDRSGDIQELAAPSHDGGRVSKDIGPSGGWLHFEDHSARGVEYWLHVPAGVVSANTHFTMKVSGGKNFRVELNASRGGVDVGALGFARPVELTVAYAAARVRSPGSLQIAWLPEGRRDPVPVTTVVDTRAKTVTGFLPHFSKYTVII